MTRQNSNNIFGGSETDTNSQYGRKQGKRMNHAAIGSSFNILYGAYGKDAPNQLEKGFKPYSKSITREGY